MRQIKWIKYKNGNYTVYFNQKDGTKIRKCEETPFRPQFPENCDVLISTKCDHGCPWCYAGCSKSGTFGELMKWNFLSSLHQYTEMALNLNFPIHPEIYWFLKYLKAKKVFANITVNQDHFMQHEEVIEDLYKQHLIYGLGVSVTTPTNEFVTRVSKYPNAVLHVINGLFTKKQIEQLKDKDLKLLILGYKDCGFGTQWHQKEKDNIQKNSQYLYDNLKKIIQYFDVVSFDNLALKQLSVKRLMTKEEWEMFYMGNDGTMTFAINLVDGTFSPNSVSPIKFEIGEKTIDEMFLQIRGKQAG